MKSWPEKILLGKPLRDARLCASHSGADERRIREREQASFERGRAEGERALGEALVQQRADLLRLQNGVLDALRQSISQTTRDCETALVELAIEVAAIII